jgi:TRAP-type C4-dicarboxylate transport system substrate-binding protein
MKQWEAVKSGVVDMHYGPPTYYKGAAPEAGVSDLATVPVPQQRKNGAFAMLDELHDKKLNSKLLMQSMNGVKFYLYTSKPHKNKRFDGFRLRSAPLYDNFFKSLGASPLRMPAPAVYTALERKTVDGLGWPLWGVSDFSELVPAKITNAPKWPTQPINGLPFKCSIYGRCGHAKWAST